MRQSPVAKRVNTISQTVSELLAYFPRYAALAGKPDINDFAFGNPHNMPLQSFTDILRQRAVPENKDWYAYKQSEPAAQATVANTLRSLHGMDFLPEDIAMTDGGAAALLLALQTVVDPGDEVMMMLPKWFLYEAFIQSAGGHPIKIPVRSDSFDLDLDAIEQAITPKTRVVIVNSPHNPTGKIYPKDTLQKLADILTSASQKNGRTIYILSDEAYNRIVFDGHKYVSPTTIYPNTLMAYTYGKTLLTPGQRLGYIALPSNMPDREMMRQSLDLMQIGSGWAYPNALLQHSIADLEKMSIDIEHLQYKRDWMVKELRQMGYQLHSPEGTFYLFVKSPIEDDMLFMDQLAKYNILCLPGETVEMSGYFRISLTANDEMIERALPGFKQAIG